MRQRPHVLTICLALLSAAACASAINVSKVYKLERPEEMKLRLGGCGGAYFLVPKGTFKLTVMKLEMSKRTVPVRAILTTPDRDVLADVWLPPDGDGTRTPSAVDFSCNVQRPGVYVLNITCPGDAYGFHVRWGFTTNCPKYMIETSRAHRDRTHEEPLLLTNRNYDAAIVFTPPLTGSLNIHMTEGIQGTTAELVDNQGNSLFKTAFDETRTLDISLPETTTPRSAPWQLKLGALHGFASIDNLTRWKKRKGENFWSFTDNSLWTDKREAWFDFPSFRKLLKPFNRRNAIPAGNTGNTQFTIENCAPYNLNVELNLEFPDGTPEFAAIDKTKLTLKPRQRKQVNVALKAPAETTADHLVCYLRATTEDFSTYSSIRLDIAQKDAFTTFTAPLKIKPYADHNKRFAVNQSFPQGAQPYFDLKNRPYINDKTIFFNDNGTWKPATILTQDGKKTNTVTTNGSKIAFDRENRIYALAYSKGQAGVIYSIDEGQTFTFVPLGVKGSLDIEQFSGQNLPPGPPPILCHTAKGTRNKKYFWRRVHDCVLVIPTFKDGKLQIPPPIPVTGSSIGLSLHSGIPSTIASKDNLTHIVWGEATDPEDKSIPGVPAYVATYDHATGKLSPPTLIAYGPPANDIHNTPCIVLDKEGYVHVVVGTHGNTFTYARTTKPHSTQHWTKPTLVWGEKLRQTYIGLVCDEQNTLHMYFRLIRPATVADLPHGIIFGLYKMSKAAEDDAWSEPVPVIFPAFTDYSVFYHRLVIDRMGALYLSYNFWPTYWFYRNDMPADKRCLIKSEDKGKTWRFINDL